MKPPRAPSPALGRTLLRNHQRLQESDKRRLHKKGKPTTPVTPVQPEAPDNLLEVLNGASIDEEHRTIMSAVVQKVQSAKSGLTEACASLLTGFEVSV